MCSNPRAVSVFAEDVAHVLELIEKLLVRAEVSWTLAMEYLHDS